MVTAAPNGEIDKFDLDIMYTQIRVLSAMAQTLNGLSASRSRAPPAPPKPVALPGRSGRWCQ
jgi:hypothetical protein